jgi:anthranilate synthase/aminodeoxychorismate synthase-like glutamine amidotransferase
VKRVLLIDNYDSFTYNLYDYIAQLGFHIEIKMNDEVAGDEQYFTTFDMLILSPGPRTPEEAGNLMNIIHLQHLKKPILGVCLGHQALGQYFGAQLMKANKPMHGKTSDMICMQHPVFRGLSNPMTVMRYHSLILKELPEQLQALAFTADNELMCFEHKHLPILGFQFHPESIMTYDGLSLLRNTLHYLAP